MKLRTSFFNIHALKKNLTRFAPLWALYALGEILGLLSLGTEKEVFWLVDDLSYIMGPLSIFHAVYGLLVAACLFGDLFESRMCNGLHAMPMKREGWLLTNLASGLIFALIPAVVGGVFGAVIFREYWWIAAVWQLVSLLQFVFFFGAAVFSAMCAGKRLGMIAVYAMVNFFSMLVFWVAKSVYEPLLPGVVFSQVWGKRFSPLTTMAGTMYYKIDIIWSEISSKAVFNGYVPESWRYLFVCGGIGVAFTALAWLLYRKRRLETAGDFIAFRPVGMVFLVLYTFATGVLVYSFGSFVGMYKNYGFLAVGIILGWFTGWMLLERTVRIFNRKVLASFALFAVLFAGSLGLTARDPMQMVSYVPETQKIDNVCLYQLNESFLYQSGENSGGWYIRDAEQIAQVQKLHSKMLETPESADEQILNMELRYVLKNGVCICRRYDVPAQSAAAEDLRLFLSDPRAVFDTEDIRQLRENMLQINVYLYGGDTLLQITDREEMEAFLEAALADCRMGAMAQHSYLHPGQDQVASVDVVWKTDQTGAVNVDPNGARNAHLQIFADCANTLACMETIKPEFIKN